ncbi:acyltransferase family protein [Streptomyces koyangensis]|uniref:acyltransferase family protein n=1 Tax=Streptomyces koyangensis TaxID=188770 RepID=UPI003CFFBA4F
MPPTSLGTAPGATAPADGAAPAAKSPAAARDPFFDNAKFLAIVLVVVGHSWEALRDDNRVLAAGYLLLYAFHMPAFTLISGYFSRSFRHEPRQLKRLVGSVLVPYAVFEVALNVFRAWAEGEELKISLLHPWYLTWFLMALFIWRLTAPLWQQVRHPILLSTAVAALASIDPGIGPDLGLQRVLQFLPFFVLGLKMRPEHFTRLRDRRVRIAAVPVLAGGALVAYWAVLRMNPDWFYRRDAAQDLNAPWWAGVSMTVGMLVCSLVLSFAFLALVPSRRTWFTALGAGTLYAYLLHGFLAKGAHFWGWYDNDFSGTVLGAVTISALAAALAVALTTAPVRRVFRCVMEPKLDWLFHDPARPSDAPNTPSGGKPSTSIGRRDGEQSAI